MQTALLVVSNRFVGMTGAERGHRLTVCHKRAYILQAIGVGSRTSVVNVCVRIYVAMPRKKSRFPRGFMQPFPLSESEIMLYKKNYPPTLAYVDIILLHDIFRVFTLNQIDARI